MPRGSSRLALALLGALLCLAACAPTATLRIVPTATTPPAPTATPSPVLAQTPTNVPAGWNVLATTYFSLAHPPNWTVETLAVDQAYTILISPNQPAVQIFVVPHADVPTYLTPYCLPQSSGSRPTTFANLPMTYTLTGINNTVRAWRFANAQQTWYQLEVGDGGASAAVQAQDTAILATFRPDNATPWRC
ncbi:MAG TPA: hypothetical protein VF818_02845 [Ktedonobacterales bacterium]